jgi:DNA-binding LacI/PurR family transcriptional regulator/DNA-binding transcriptional regulator YhcF (GntR family)
MAVAADNLAVQQLAPPKARVMRSLRAWIERGDIARGEPLPSERVLAERLAVARGTVRSALDELVRQGVLNEGNGRRRTVRKSTLARPAPVEAGLMAHAIGVLMGREGRISDRLDAPGFEVFIELGAFDAVADAGLHGIKLYPDRLTGEGIQKLIDSRPMGVVVGRFPGDRQQGEAMAKALRDAHVPVVLYGDSEFNDDFDRVYSDHEQGTYNLTRWLIEQGRRRILRFWPPNREHLRWVQARARGFERACREAGVPLLEPMAMPAISHSLGEKDRFDHNVRLMGGHLIERLTAPADQAPDALMMISDGDVYPTAAACRLYGKEPNVDIALVGYDNYWSNLVDRQFEPIAPAATVDKLNPTLGQELVKLLVARVEGKLPLEPAKRVIQPRLVVPDARP